MNEMNIKCCFFFFFLIIHKHTNSLSLSKAGSRMFYKVTQVDRVNCCRHIKYFN